MFEGAEEEDDVGDEELVCDPRFLSTLSVENLEPKQYMPGG